MRAAPTCHEANIDHSEDHCGLQLRWCRAGAAVSSRSPMKLVLVLAALCAQTTALEQQAASLGAAAQASSPWAGVNVGIKSDDAAAAAPAKKDGEQFQFQADVNKLKIYRLTASL